ncbi:MAG: J domain-containing protein [Pseudomonadota bacterium]
MDGYELIAVVVFFMVGYWAVDFFWPKKKADAAPPAPAPMAGNAAPAENAPWHEVLGVPSDATLEQIRKAYEEKSAEYHPDRVAGMGPEFRETAMRLTRRVNDAFDEAMRSR